MLTNSSLILSPYFARSQIFQQVKIVISSFPEIQVELRYPYELSMSCSHCHSAQIFFIYAKSKRSNLIIYLFRTTGSPPHPLME